MPGDEQATANDSGPRGPLSLGWQVTLSVAWLAAFFAFAATWKVSDEIGIGTWWLGARAQPQPTLVRVIPFSLTLLAVLVVIGNPRRLPILSMIGALGVAAIAVFDMERSGGLAAIEFAIAGCLFVVSLASLAGRQVVRPRAAAAPAVGVRPGDPLPPPSPPG